MTTNQLRILLLTVLFTFAFPAAAGEWTEFGKIEIFLIKSDPDAVFIDHEYGINPDFCDHSRNGTIEDSREPFRKLFFFLLEAYSQDLRVKLYYDGCSESGHPRITQAKARRE